ncbi:hypothetical protein ES703_94173 [subsurface metagenome]
MADFHYILVTVNNKSQQLLTLPPHQSGLLPQWLSELSVALVIVDGMGRRAQQLFAENNIDVVVGAPDNEPQELISQYLASQLKTGQNICDH